MWSSCSAGSGVAASSVTAGVAAGTGAGWLLCPLADSLQALERVAEPPAEFDTQLWVLAHPDLRRVARVKALTDFLYARLTEDARLQHD